MLDCGSRFCELSIQHPKTCKSRTCSNVRVFPSVEHSCLLAERRFHELTEHLVQYLGAEIQKSIVTYDEFCWACQSTGRAVAA